MSALCHKYGSRREMWIVVQSVLPLHGLSPGPHKQPLLCPHVIESLKTKQ